MVIRITIVARNLFLSILCAIESVRLGRACYAAYQTGEFTLKGRTSRRDREPISYWIGMIAGTIAFLVLASATVITAFLVCAELVSHKPK